MVKIVARKQKEGNESVSLTKPLKDAIHASDGFFRPVDPFLKDFRLTQLPVDPGIS